MASEAMDVDLGDLMDNPTPRLPVVLCLDVSGSMWGEPIDELNQGVRLFIENVLSDPIAAASVELCVVTFGDNAELLADFQAVMNVTGVMRVDARNECTNLGEGVELAVKSLNERKEKYKRAAVDYYQPWLVLFSDGEPNVPTVGYHIKVARRVKQMVAEKKLTVFPIGIGREADMDALALFSDWTPMRLKGLNFREFFQWLSASVSRVSQSRPGDKVELDLEGIKGWGEI
jgi:uncharacterized protein YegL